MKPPLSTQVRVFARMLGMDYDDIEWDHTHCKGLGGKDDRRVPNLSTKTSRQSHSEAVAPVGAVELKGLA